MRFATVSVLCFTFSVIFSPKIGNSCLVGDRSYDKNMILDFLSTELSVKHFDFHQTGQKASFYEITRDFCRRQKIRSNANRGIWYLIPSLKAIKKYSINTSRVICLLGVFISIDKFSVHKWWADYETDTRNYATKMLWEKWQQITYRIFFIKCHSINTKPKKKSQFLSDFFRGVASSFCTER